MTTIKFINSIASEMGEVVKTKSNYVGWYDYESKKCANTETED